MEDVDRRFECLKILTESIGSVCYIENKEKSCYNCYNLYFIFYRYLPCV